VSGSIFSFAFQGLKYGKVWNAKIDSRLVSSSTTSLGVKPSVGDTVLAEVDDIVGTLDRPAIALKVHTYIHTYILFQLFIFIILTNLIFIIFTIIIIIIIYISPLFIAKSWKRSLSRLATCA
jgi:hypothetical protein